MEANTTTRFQVESEAQRSPDLTKVHLLLQIPPMYRDQPLLSDLANHHGTQLTIVGASLPLGTQESGWFDIELIGTFHQVELAIAQLQNLEVTIWHRGIATADHPNARVSKLADRQPWDIDF
jgi:hypothetical protein